MITGRRVLSAAGMAAVCAVLFTSGVGAPCSALAQTQAASSSASSDTATVTIFGRKRPVSVKSFSQMSSASASSCSFGNNEAQEDIYDSYLSGMGYDSGDMTLSPPSLVLDPDTGAPMPDPWGARTRTNDRAVFGDVSQTTGNKGYTNPADMSGGASGYNTTVQGSPGACTVADDAFSAGRNFIARKDTTYRDAVAAYNAKDYTKALGLFEKSYNKVGYDEAALVLGQMYLYGLGTARDVDKAVFWLKKVAETPVPVYSSALIFDPAHPYAIDTRTRAIMALGGLYMTGQGVAKNPSEARKWFMRADESGYVPATYDVGRMYLSGYGGEKSASKAAGYFDRAGKAGFAPAQYALGQIYYDGADGVAQDKTKAGAWLLLAAKAGYPDALYAVGRMYELGEGGAKADLPKALTYYKEAAVKGQVDAELTLATYLYTGEGGAPKDLVTARKLFEAAAEAGDQDAMFNLGVMMTNGEGGPRDLVHAYCWFYIADKGGVVKAKAAMQELAGKMTPDERAQAETLLNPKAGAQ
jgi:TPR repeat protein